MLGKEVGPECCLVELLLVLDDMNFRMSQFFSRTLWEPYASRRVLAASVGFGLCPGGKKTD
jgi:hypothetical protein